MLRWLADKRLIAKVARLNRQLRRMQADLDGAEARLAVAQVEIEHLSAILARDRQRVLAETAGYAAQRAAAEGTAHAQQSVN